MKQKLTPEIIIKKHIASDEIIDSLTMTDDYKTSNKEAKKLQKLFIILEKNLDLAKAVYSALLQYPCITTQITAASECLKLSIYQNESIKILEEMSLRNDIGIRSLNAKMVLKVWRGEIPGKTL